MGLPAPLGVLASGTPATGDAANAVISGTFASVGPGVPFTFLGPYNLLIWCNYNTSLTTTAGTLNFTVASAGTLAPGVAVNGVNVPPGSTVGTLTGTSGTLALPAISLTGNVYSGSSSISGLVSTTGLIGATAVGAGIPAGTTITGILQAATFNAGVLIPGTAIMSASATVTAIGKAVSFALAGSSVLSGTDTNASFTGAPIAYSGSVQLERSFDGGSTWIVGNVGGQGNLAVWNLGTPISLLSGEAENTVLLRLNCTSFTSGPINYRISETGSAAMSLAISSAV